MPALFDTAALWFLTVDEVGNSLKDLKPAGVQLKLYHCVNLFGTCIQLVLRQILGFLLSVDAGFLI